jgi:restriction system protein
MRPVLEALANTDQLPIKDLYTTVAQIAGLSDEIMQEVIPSGQARFKNRIGWAATHLVRAGAVERPQRGTYSITQRGRDLLAEDKDVTEQRLLEFPEFVEFVERSKPTAHNSTVAVTTDASTVSPEELIEAAAQELRAVVESDLLNTLQTMDAMAFERLVLRVLRGMGYGKDGSLNTTKTSGDDGIDGIISQDPLGLDRIYLQAKRYQPDAHVGGPEMQKFIGALTVQQGDRGIFITSSTFTSKAREFSETARTRIELIDGQRLAKLMIDNQVGVQPAFTTTVYKIDGDFFEDL